MAFTYTTFNTPIPTESAFSDKYDPWNIKDAQRYNPMYSLFFDLNEETSNTIAWKQTNFIFDKKHIVHSSFPEVKIPCDIHIKSAPLLDPIHFLIGKYDKEKHKIRNLPQLNSTLDTCIEKVINSNNTSYVDCFFNFLSSEVLNKHKIVNGIDFYGSFLAIQKYYYFNVSDDLEYLSESSYFVENNKKLYEIPSSIHDQKINESVKWNSDKKRPKIKIENDDVLLDDVVFDDDIVNEDTDTVVGEKGEDLELVYEFKKSEDDDDDSDSSSVNYSTEDEDDDDEDEDDEDDDDEDEDDDDEDEDDEDEDDEDEDDDDDEDEDDEDVPLYIYDFPIQMIALEKCEGTLDELLENKMINEEEIASALIQVIFTLLAYQKMFSFTHNDLHTNNILYVTTKKTHVWYKYNKKTFKIPTFGRIYKIIDFGRAIYRFQGKLFCSDSFSPKGDAHGQYNTEPYLNEDKVRIDPNPSFDLCRLGCSIYDFIFDCNEPLPSPISMTALQKLIYDWCTDDSGNNVLYKKNGEERYPNFKLYKMISRIVHNKTPQDQLKLPFFEHFLTKSRPQNTELMDLDELPYLGDEKNMN